MHFSRLFSPRFVNRANERMNGFIVCSSESFSACITFLRTAALERREIERGLETDEGSLGKENEWES